MDHLAKGTHEIRAVATDNEGRTGESQITIAVEEPTGNYVFSRFDSEGCVPDGWTTYDGQERRTGFATGFSSGSRVFHFTGDKHDFDYGLYTRNVTGQHNAGYARFAEKGTSTTLTLHPGNYQVFARMANWNQPGFSPVTIAVEDSKGQAVYAETFTPTANVGNSAANSFDGVTMNTMTFDIDQTATSSPSTPPMRRGPTSWWGARPSGARATLPPSAPPPPTARPRTGSTTSKASPRDLLPTASTSCRP